MESPYESLPNLSSLLDKFHEALKQEMQQYFTHQDSFHFQKILDKLGSDLSEFIKSIDIWHDLSTSVEQVKELRQIEEKIDSAQHLITKAIGLLKPEPKAGLLN